MPTIENVNSNVIGKLPPLVQLSLRRTSKKMTKNPVPKISRNNILSFTRNVRDTHRLRPRLSNRMKIEYMKQVEKNAIKRALRQIYRPPQLLGTGAPGTKRARARTYENVYGGNAKWDNWNPNSHLNNRERIHRYNVIHGLLPGTIRGDTSRRYNISGAASLLSARI